MRLHTKREARMGRVVALSYIAVVRNVGVLHHSDQVNKAFQMFPVSPDLSLFMWYRKPYFSMEKTVLPSHQAQIDWINLRE